MEEVVRYTYRLRPGAQAEVALLAEWHRCRWLWNEAVHQQRSGCKPTRAKLGKLLTDARRRCAWLREGWQNAQANVLRDAVCRRDELPAASAATTLVERLPFLRVPAAR